MKVLIVDDEPESHVVLRTHLESHFPELILLDEADSMQKGLEYVKKHKPDLLLLDVEMPKGNGFDLLKAAQKQGLLKFQVIFITAHNQYAQTAIRFGALDYLLKPVSSSELSAAVLKAKVNRLEIIHKEQMEIILETLDKLKTQELPLNMSISTNDGILYFPTQNIIRLEAMQNFTEFKLEKALQPPHRLIASFNLKKYEIDLKPFRIFMRIHRSYIVNLHKVVRFKKGERYFLEMIDGAILPVSKKMIGELNRRLGDLSV